MKRSTIRSIIILASFLLSSLIIVQIIWLIRAYQLQETQVNYDITKSLKLVSEEILMQAGDSSFLIDPVAQINRSTFIVKTNETPDPYYVEQVLTREFKNQEINLDFEYNLYNCFNDSVIYTKAIYINQGKALEKEQPSVEVNWKSDDGHYFSVYFPNKSDIILGRLQFWLYSSLLLVVIILFFAYTIGIILKQKRLSDVKTDFINNMTHELKTPISTIALSSEVLMKPDIIEQPDRLSSYASIINRENQRMQQQVEKVLQVATLEKDQLELNLKSLDLHSITQEVIKTFTPKIEEQNGRIDFQSSKQNLMVLGDETHLSNVVTNLIDNAIKYCSEKPQIEIALHESGQNICLSIKDNGIGISHETQKHIFEKFYRVPTGNIHDVKGFGLGLHYASVMIREHHGSIAVSSAPGKGSVFTITLPSNK